MYDFEVEWMPLARHNLLSITRYIAEQGYNPAAAEKLQQKIVDTANKLSFSPYRVFFDKRRGLRKCNVGNYLIIFKIIENATPKRVLITQIIHGRRNLRRQVR